MGFKIDQCQGRSQKKIMTEANSDETLATDRETTVLFSDRSTKNLQLYHTNEEGRKN